jgi:hypothetical protein
MKVWRVDVLYFSTRRAPTKLGRPVRFFGATSLPFEGGNGEMYILKQFLCGAAVVCLTFPVWAHAESMDLDVSQPTMVGTTQLQPGDYILKVEDNATQIQVERDGAVVAEVACHWTQLPQKPTTSQVLMTSDRVTEVDFRGKTEAVTIG